MNTQGTPHARSPWHLSTWSDYLIRFIHPRQQEPVRMTRRQELLAAQERKRQEHRAHVLELLREVKEKHHHEVMHTK
jgi:predicted GTPase